MQEITTTTPTFKKARFAPTPSGYLHLGNVLSFAITAALAEQSGAKILLRIDDADRERTNKLYVQDIFDTLNFLEIPWHEGPKNMHEYETQFSQMHRLELYSKALNVLREQNDVFACTCSRTDVARLSAKNIYAGTCRNKNIPLTTTDTSWRLHTDMSRLLTIKSFPGKIMQSTLPEIMQNFIVKKRDGYAAYQLTSIIDDDYFGVDLVVRGDDLWASTLAQQYLSLQLGIKSFSEVTFYHHPLLMDDQGQKLSKSIGSTSVQYFRKQNRKPEDIYAIISTILGVEGGSANWQELVQLLGMKNRAINPIAG